MGILKRKTFVKSLNNATSPTSIKVTFRVLGPARPLFCPLATPLAR